MKHFYYLIIALIFLWGGGFAYYIHSLTKIEAPTNEKTDGIVVLTGGNSRIQEAVHLLEDGLAKKLFISGVNAKVTDDELHSLLGSSQALIDCCIESGTTALNTAGNAREIFLWVSENKMSSIRVVTSLEHMPRAMVEIKHLMPDIKMIAHPVGQWRPENTRFFSLAREYSKYLVTLFRTLLLEKDKEELYRIAHADESK